MSVSISARVGSDDVLNFLRQHGDSLWDAQSMIAELQCHWIGDSVSFALRQTAMVRAPDELMKPMYLHDDQKLQHRVSLLRNSDGGKVAELQAWVYLAHPRLFGTRQAHELATTSSPLTEVLIYGLGARRHTIAVEPMTGESDGEGDGFAILVTAWLALGRPVARVQERIYASVLDNARPRLRAALPR